MNKRYLLYSDKSKVYATYTSQVPLVKGRRINLRGMDWRVIDLITINLNDL